MELSGKHFVVVPEEALPPDRAAVVVEVDGHPHVLIGEGHATQALVNDLDRLVEHIVRHGLCEPQRGDNAPPRMRQVS